MNELPRRPFTELSAPTGGFADARNAAKRRRRAKAAAASTASAAVVAVVLALSGPPSLTGQDRLQVTTPGESGSPVPTASAETIPDTGSESPSPGPVATVAAGSSPGAGAGAGQAEQSGAPAPAGSAQPGGVAYRTPGLSRDYSASHAVLGSGTSFCAGTTTRDDSGTHSTVNWCHSALVTPTSSGHTLAAQLCRDGSSGKQLTYSTAREVDLEVKRAGRTVWRWSTGHSFADTAHVLQVEADHCWTWSLAWTDVDAGGRPLPKGDYELWVTSYGAEMEPAPEASIGFTL